MNTGPDHSLRFRKRPAILLAASTTLAILELLTPHCLDAAILPRWTKKKAPAAAEWSAARVNSSKKLPVVGVGSKGGAVLRAEILLDRANLSPGLMEGAYNVNLGKAIAAFQRKNDLPVTRVIADRTWDLLNRDGADLLIDYTLDPADVAGPFTPIPRLMMQKAKLERMNYESPIEGLSEKFHISAPLLRRLNPTATFRKAGERLIVPNLEFAAPGQASRVVVDRSELALRAYSAEDELLAHYPVSVGSGKDPLPIGTWKVNGVSREPVYNYNPKLFWDADPKDTKAKIAPGPNNPVGLVWIDLSKPHYGIHGTPEPGSIGRTNSHGCIRLTNWAAVQLASMVKPGTTVILQE